MNSLLGGQQWRHTCLLLQCENNPLECYTAMYEAVISQPCLSFEQDCQCGSCSERVTEFFHLGPCSHKLCKACLRKMFDQLNDECLVCNEPIRELAFCKQPGSMPPPPALVPPPLALPTKATPAPAPACEECPVFASILKRMVCHQTRPELSMDTRKSNRLIYWKMTTYRLLLRDRPLFRRRT